jgi:lipopolysaccharide export system protein LptA
LRAATRVDRGRLATSLAAAVVAAVVVAAPEAHGQQGAAAPTPRPVVEGQRSGQGQRGGESKPIEIVADRLQVDQDQQLATFIGNVDAVQGDMTLRADRLRVFYADAAQDTAAASGGGGGANAGAGGGGGSDQSIRRIEAEGNVILSQPGETAEGDAGVYDPVANTLVLEGNVVLTRGQNVVRGNRLDSNLQSGVSVVTAAPGGKRDQRVRALFVQERRNEGSP